MENSAALCMHRGSSNKTMKSLEKQFAEKTTCHGLRCISESPDFPTKIMWTEVILLAMACLIYGITSMALFYATYPSYIAMHTRVRIDGAYKIR